MTKLALQEMKQIIDSAQIESDVPIPPLNLNRNRVTWKNLLEKLEVGQSFIAPARY